MKKVFMTMAVLTGLVAGGIVFSSFTTPQQERANGVLEFKVNDPIYWQGRAVKYNGSLQASSWVEINVYQSANACNSFYAVITNSNLSYTRGDQVWVKENPNYDSDSRQRNINPNVRKYYITYGGKDFYFDM